MYLAAFLPKLNQLLLTILVATTYTLYATDEIALPDIGDSSGTIISPEQERRLGLAAIREIRKSTQVLSDPEIEMYIQSLGNRLTSYSDTADQAFNFFLVEHPTINAFAIPGGFIGVHTGLILNTQKESELASVLAHEIAHVTQRHMARTFEKASQFSLPLAAAMLGAIFLGSQNPQAGQAALALLQAGSTQFQIDFTRANEEEADRVGMKILVKSGFDPRSMPTFFERLQRANRFTDDPRLPEFLRTHPVTVSRISDSRNRAESFPRQTFQNSIDFHLIRTKLQLAAISNAKQAIKFYSDALQKENNTVDDTNSILRYGYALALARSRQYLPALEQLKILILRDPQQVAYLLAQAQIQMDAAQTKESINTYETLLSLNANNRAVIYGYAQTLLTTGNIDKARTILRNYAVHNEPDIHFYRLLADAEGKAGSQVEAHIALAEGEYLQGNTELAMKQLEFARRDTKVDHYQRHRIEARLLEFKKQFKDEQKMMDKM